MGGNEDLYNAIESLRNSSEFPLPPDEFAKTTEDPEIQKNGYHAVAETPDFSMVKKC